MTALSKLKGASTRENSINKSLLLKALKDSGYSRIEAISDLIDNSIDAGATSIKLDLFNFNGKPVIALADNGSGMDETMLLNALSVGSTRSDRPKSDRGKYGMGLTSASASLGDDLMVMSKQAGTYYGYGYQVADITESSWPVKDYRSVFNEALFNMYLPGVLTGTLVLIRQVDKFHATELADYRAELVQALGINFRKFIPGISFAISKRTTLYPNKQGVLTQLEYEEIKPIDPLLLEHGSQVLMHKVAEYNLGGQKVSLELKAVMLPEDDPKLPGTEINVTHQGFYILRNQRQIDGGSSFQSCLRKHNMYNRFRAEISFSTMGDTAFGVNYQKRGYTPSTQLIDLIDQEFQEVIKQVKLASFASAIRKKNEFTNLDKRLGNLASNLVSGLIDKGEGGMPPSKPKAEAAPTDKEEKVEREKRVQKGYKKLGLNAPQIEYYEGGADGPLYTYLTGETRFLLRLNVDHILYKAAHSNSLDTTELFRLLLLANAITEAQSIKTNALDDDALDLLEELREQSSMGLSSLTNLYLGYD